MKFVLLVAALGMAACTAQVFHEFDVTRPSKVAELPPPPPTSPGHSHVPYVGIPKALASARPMQATNATTTKKEPECATRSQRCDDRLRAVLATIDGQILALTTPPSETQLAALKLQLIELQPLLAPYPDMMSERDELAQLIDKFPSLSEVDQGSARKRMTELTDLVRVQLAAAQ
jgi:hypothetical protein